MGDRVVQVGDRLARSALRISVAASPVGALILLVIGLAASWSLTYVLGGADGIVPHFYYLPIVFAAVRFGPVAALVVALVSGVLAGPMTYLEVAEATSQSFARWGTRTGFFVVVGLVMSSMVRPSLPSITEEVRRRRLEGRLRRAIREDELLLRYQPVTRLDDGRIRAVEALLRWRGRDGEERPPGAFLPHVERSAVMLELGAYVVATACDQAARWQQRYGLDAAPVVSVNASARELEDPGLVARVRDGLETSGLDPALLCIEITESTLIDDADGTAARLAELKQLGVRIAIDDFGTGYSSLASVHRFPLDILKVDRAFVAPIGDDVTEEVLWGILVLARSLSLTTVAEGVESEAQHRAVAALGYHLAQGYHYARPLLADEVTRLLDDGAPLCSGPDPALRAGQRQRPELRPELVRGEDG